MKVSVKEIEYDEAKASAVDPKDTEEFAESIRDQGQLQAILLRPGKHKKYQLVAGLRRILAIVHLGEETIEAEVRDIADNSVEIVSLHENLLRHNLPWYDEVILKRRLHELRQSQFGGKSGRGRPKRGEVVWGVRDTARELGIVAVGHLSDDLHLAKAVEADPSLRNIKDKKTAIRLIKNKVQRDQTEEEALGSFFESSNPAADEVLLGSSAEILKGIPDGTFDACVTDPPWLKFKDKKLIADDDTVPVFKEVYRVLKFNTLLYMFVGIDDYILYKDKLPQFGFLVSKTPLIWKKVSGFSNMGVAPWEYARDFELILLAAKGKPVLTHSTQQSSIYEFPVVPPRALVHPNEKPIDLLKKILGDCTYEGHRVLDPFGGSGVTAHACRELNRRYTIIERDESYCVNIRKRLEA